MKLSENPPPEIFKIVLNIVLSCEFDENTFILCEKNFHLKKFSENKFYGKIVPIEINIDEKDINIKANNLLVKLDERENPFFKGHVKVAQ